MEEEAEDVEIAPEEQEEVEEPEEVVEKTAEEDPVEEEKVEEPEEETPEPEGEPEEEKQEITELSEEKTIDEPVDEEEKKEESEAVEDIEEPEKESPADEEKTEETEEEPKEEVQESTPEPNLDDPLLAGVRETLDSYSNEELDQIITIAKIYSKSDRKEDKVKLILTLPLEKVNDILDEFARKQEECEEQEPVEELTEDDLDEETPTPDDIEEEKEEPEEESSEEESDEKTNEDDDVEKEEPAEKKKGFFGRLFGKKKDEDKDPKEEPEDEIEEPSEPEEATEEPVEEEKTEEEKEDEEIDKEFGVEEELAPEEPEIEDDADLDEEFGKTPSDITETDKDITKVDEEIKEVEEDLEEVDRQEDMVDEVLEEVTEEEPKKKGFFGKVKEAVSGKKLSETKFEEIFFELEVVLLENNVAVEVIEKIKTDLKENLVDKKLNRFEIEKVIMKTLKSSVEQILSVEGVDILARIREKEGPFTIIFAGINGSGKTTTIGKMAQYFLDNDLKVVMVASDTFRAAAIQQLEEHANNLGVKMIKHDYGSDPAAVAFDGIKYAESKGIDVVLVDTAGRLHSNVNLMDEMKKIIRVANPDMKIFIGESITGNDCVEQAQKFNEAIELDGLVLSKADVDEKGGAALSVSYVTGKPILFLGVGQEYKDLQKFDKKVILDNLGL